MLKASLPMLCLGLNPNVEPVNIAYNALSYKSASSSSSIANNHNNYYGEYSAPTISNLVKIVDAPAAKPTASTGKIDNPVVWVSINPQPIPPASCTTEPEKHTLTAGVKAVNSLLHVRIGAELTVSARKNTSDNNIPAENIMSFISKPTSAEFENTSTKSEKISSFIYSETTSLQCKKNFIEFDADHPITFTKAVQRQL